MEFGLQLGGLEWEELRDVAQAAEELGYDLIAFPDHLIEEGLEGQYDPHTILYESTIAAAVLCEATKRIRIAHLVLCNLFRHPVMTAQALMSLDRLSHGRLVAGLGAGWTEREFRMAGLPFPAISVRLRMLDEALTCIRSLWTQEETTFHGEFYRFDAAILWPKPVQQPHPPILLGGSGRGLLRVAAKHADVVNLIADVGKAGQATIAETAKVTDEGYRAKIRFLREEVRNNGREPARVQVSNAIFAVILADSPSAAEATAAQMAPMFGMPAEALRRSPIALIGTPEQCTEELVRRQKEWGVSQFIFMSGNHPIMQKLAEEVIAHVPKL